MLNSCNVSRMVGMNIPTVILSMEHFLGYSKVFSPIASLVVTPDRSIIVVRCICSGFLTGVTTYKNRFK